MTVTMRIGRLAAIAWLLPLAQAHAALPRNGSAREFEAVVQEAAKVLESRPIDAVERLDGGVYVVRAGPCRLEVRIVPRTRSNPGPQLFDTQPGRPDCR